MKKRRLTALLMVGVMTASLLAGCSGEKNTEESASVQTQPSENITEEAAEKGKDDEKTITFPLDEPIEVTVYCCTGDAAMKLEDTAIFRAVSETQ